MLGHPDNGLVCERRWLFAGISPVGIDCDREWATAMVSSDFRASTSASKACRVLSRNCSSRKLIYHRQPSLAQSTRTMWTMSDARNDVARAFSGPDMTFFNLKSDSTLTRFRMSLFPLITIQHE